MHEDAEKVVAKKQKAIDSWKQWHRKLVDVLGLEYVEANLTLGAVRRLKQTATTRKEALTAIAGLPETNCEDCKWAIELATEALKGD